MPKWIDAEQGTEAWLNARVGCLTASKIKDAMDITKKGEDGAKRKQLKLDILAEVLTGLPTPVFVNNAMKWGTETEPAARIAYSSATGNDVTLCGLAMHDDIPYFGASPDGLVGDDGLIEIKCPTSSTMVKWLVDGGIPEEHELQMLAQLAVTGPERKWCDFIAYDPRMAEGYQIMIRRFEPDRKRIEEVETAARYLLDEVREMYDTIRHNLA